MCTMTSGLRFAYHQCPWVLLLICILELKKVVYEQQEWKVA